MPPQVNKVMTEKEFIRSGRGMPPDKGEVKRANREIYYTVDTNQIFITSDDNLIGLTPSKVYDLPKSHNCRNCGQCPYIKCLPAEYGRNIFCRKAQKMVAEMVEYMSELNDKTPPEWCPCRLENTNV